MSINIPFKKLFLATAVVALVVGVFLVHALAGLGAQPVAFVDPPAFVERYAADMDHSEPPSASTEPDAAKLTTDFSEEDALVRHVILDGNSPNLLLRLFAHPEKAKRVKVALALAALNAELTHDEPSGFAAKREQFWVDVEEHLADIQNALYEALIASAEEGTSNRIPYTLAWMPGQGEETIEVLAWAAKHHPDPWVRRFSVFFVVEFGENEDLAVALLSDRTHDPDYKVRKEVLDQRIRRLLG